jgi:ubiquinone/menaquinone biosynthesis C-methylase UbiE
MSVQWGAGLHTSSGGRVDAAAYEQYIGRWSRLFVPALLDAAEVGVGDRVLDVATGSGEAALMAMGVVGETGLVVGADVSSAMLTAASTRLSSSSFLPVATDGQTLAFRDASFDAVICQLGLMFFPDPTRGLAAARRVLCPGRCASVCVISLPERAPMWGVLADTLSRYLPSQARAMQLSFSLADPARLEHIFDIAGFRDVRVRPETRQGSFESFDEYWAPIESGVGQLPQAYLALPETSRRSVRDEVCTRLAQFEANGRLVMSVEMLIGSGRA